MPITEKTRLVAKLQADLSESLVSRELHDPWISAPFCVLIDRTTADYILSKPFRITLSLTLGAPFDCDFLS